MSFETARMLEARNADLSSRIRKLEGKLADALKEIERHSIDAEQQAIPTPKKKK